MGPTPTSCARRFSVSNDLKYDAERDLRDIDASSIAVHALNKVGASPHPPPGVGAALPVRLRMRTHVHPSFQIKYGDNTTSEGVLFATYSALIGESQAGGQHRTRIRQILEWCGSAFDGVVSWPAQGWGGGGGPTGEGLQGRGRGSGRGAASPGGWDMAGCGACGAAALCLGRALSVTPAGEPRGPARPPGSSWLDCVADSGWCSVAGKCRLAVPGAQKPLMAVPPPSPGVPP